MHTLEKRIKRESANKIYICILCLCVFVLYIYQKEIVQIKNIATIIKSSLNELNSKMEITKKGVFFFKVRR